MTRRPKPTGPQPGKRRHPRRQVALWAQVDGTLRHPVLNLSEGGLFLLTEAPLVVGQTLHLEIPLPDRTLRVEGTVRHATATEDFAGNGIQLEKLAPEDTTALRDFLDGKSIAA